jgi:hypothetical protein
MGQGRATDNNLGYRTAVDPYASIHATTLQLWCDSPLLSLHYGTPHTRAHTPIVHTCNDAALPDEARFR